MKHFFNLLTTDYIFTFFVFGFVFLFIFFLCSFFLYVYININLKNICKIIVDDEMWYRTPLSPLTFHLLSALPIVFGKEYLNIKYNIKFKKLYSKNYYFSLNESELKELINKYPIFFYTQYFILFSGVSFIFFIGIATILSKFL